MIIRRERPDDVDAIREVHRAAFADPRGRLEPVTPEDAGAPPPDPVEARLVDDLRADPAAWLPQLSLVAEAPPGGQSDFACRSRTSRRVMIRG